MPVETRYFKNASIDNNGLTCKDLGTAQTSSATYASHYSANDFDGIFGIRVWKRAVDGTETEITSGTPVAQMQKAQGTSGIDSATWTCPQAVLLPTDSIIIRVYIKLTYPPWVLLDTWQTEDLGPGYLEATTWTVYYSWYSYYVGAPTYLYYWRFRYGDASVDSRITNFSRTVLSQMFGPAASLRIYKQGAAANPKSVEVTFTLQDTDDAPLVGKTIEFTVSLGCTRSPTSAVTDENGQASTTVTSGTTIGWAVVKGYYSGDAGGGESKTYVEIAVYDEADSGDADKKYQVFIQGMPRNFSGGAYSKSIGLDMQEFSIELPDVDTTITGAFEVIIYRRGTKDFVGRINKIKRTSSHSMRVSGVSNHWKLARRIVNRSYTEKDPHDIIEDVLTRYPTGLSLGSIGTFGTAITQEFKYATVLEVIRKLLDITGWKARLNLDESLDFASDFGDVKSVTFEIGDENVDLEREIDYTPLDTRTFLIGEPATLVSDKDDASAEAAYGLVEQAFFDKNATTQAVLDVENQAILDSRKNPIERIGGLVIDLHYAADAYDVFDRVTVTDPPTGLSGVYRVVALTRDMKDCGTAQIQFTNQSLESQDLLAQVARIVKDLSV
jgi:hypothetical protein